jgi:hypothetical protein
MKQVIRICAPAWLMLIATASVAQFVKGNEAVTVIADGGKRVETPPLPPRSVLAKPCPAAQAGCAGGGWNMVETPNGLLECTEIYARTDTCRPSTYGTERRARLWIVKHDSLWLQCQFPDLASKCVSTKALPFSAVQ